MFDDVCEGIIKQHGENWFYPPLVSALKKINCLKISSTDNLGSVSVHSFEVWDKNGDLVAGEAGYAVGGCYTSLSGYYEANSAGSVQMAATGCLLRSHGFHMWDLGMDLEYKRSLGAILLSKGEFFDKLKNCRDDAAVKHLCLNTKTSAKNIIDSL